MADLLLSHSGALGKLSGNSHGSHHTFSWRGPELIELSLSFTGPNGNPKSEYETE
jgi:hypothetical protein